MSCIKLVSIRKLANIRYSITTKIRVALEVIIVFISKVSSY